MKNNRNISLTIAAAIMSIFLISSVAGATVSANLTYLETALPGGWYQYDYTAFNTSTTANVFLYDIGFWHYNEAATFEWLSMPNGWGLPGTYDIRMLEIYSVGGFAYDIPVGGSLSGFSFKTDYQAGSIEFDAAFMYHTPPSGSFAGQYSGMTSGTSVPVVPEPISSILFLSGGATLAVRRLRKRQNA